METIRWKDVPEEGRELLKSAANRIWDIVGDDMFMDDMGKRDYSMTFTWETLMDVCGDRMHDVGRNPDSRNENQLSEEQAIACMEYFVPLDRKDREEYGKFFFPGTYGY